MQKKKKIQTYNSQIFWKVKSSEPADALRYSFLLSIIEISEPPSNVYSFCNGEKSQIDLSPQSISLAGLVDHIGYIINSIARVFNSPDCSPTIRDFEYLKAIENLKMVQCSNQIRHLKSFECSN